MSTIHFYECQQLRKYWFWLLLLVVSIPATVLIFITIGETNKNGSPTGMLVPAIIAGVVMLVLLLLFYISYLRVEIDEQMLSFKFSPFHFSKQKINWDDVAEAAVIRYNPLFEFGGWGLRYSFRKGKAYTIWGKTCLRIKLHNGKQINIGTQKQTELEQVIQLLYKLKRIRSYA